MKTILFAVYRPGESGVEGFTEVMDRISEDIRVTQANGQYPSIMGLGDFNFPDVSWVPGMLPSTRSESVEGRQLKRLIEFLREHLMYQVVNDPTRKKNILDLVLVNEEKIIRNYSQIVNVNISDHNTILLRMNCYPKKIKKQRQCKNYYTTNLHKLDMRRKNNEDLRWNKFTKLMDEQDWSDEGYESEVGLDDTNENMTFGNTIDKQQEVIGDMVRQWSNNIEKCANLAFDVKQNKKAGNYIPLGIRKLMKEKKQWSKKIMISKDPVKIMDLANKIEEAEISLKNSYNKSRLSKEAKIIPMLKDDPSLFYSYAKSFDSIKEEIGPLVDKEGILTRDEVKMANILSKQYEDMWSKPVTGITADTVKEFFGCKKASGPSGTGVGRGGAPPTNHLHHHQGSQLATPSHQHNQPSNPFIQGMSEETGHDPNKNYIEKSNEEEDEIKDELNDVEINLERVKEALGLLSL